MPLTNEERAYMQGMQMQINALQNDIQNLQRWKQEMDMRDAYQQGQQSQMRRFGDMAEQEKANHNRMTNEGAPAPKDE